MECKVKDIGCVCRLNDWIVGCAVNDNDLEFKLKGTGEVKNMADLLER